VWEQREVKMAKSWSLSVGKFIVSLGISKKSVPSPCADKITFNHVAALEQRFAELTAFGFVLTTQNAVELSEFYIAYLPLVYTPAQSAHLRSLLQRLRTRTRDSVLKKAATHAIAISDLSDGVVDRAIILRDDPQKHVTWKTEVDRFEQAYGAPLIQENWSNADRGRTLIAYFDAHPDVVRGKAILHFAPEAELRNYFQANKRTLGYGQYVTADGFHRDVDENQDITTLTFPDNSFDLVICHRVMEHVLNDHKGFSELWNGWCRTNHTMDMSASMAPTSVTECSARVLRSNLSHGC
jgi:hypothetical protein